LARTEIDRPAARVTRRLLECMGELRDAQLIAMTADDL
jgi:hypothetical protein